ncbi:MAG: sugar ABC transporter substrate-binding protein [Micropruina sp.]|uniref:ABC transporter substrate-binding protein n=1 Tax=Micropruina sp. TaxID=2737536 RepID=UPI0039E45B4F
MTSKRPKILAAAAAAALMLSGCSGSGSGQNPAPAPGDSSAPATVVWSTWGTPSELKRYEEFNAKFMAKHSNIKVTLQSVPSYSDYHAKLLAQLTSKTAPDVFYVGDDKIGQFVDSGALMDVTEVLKAPNAVAPYDAFNPATFGAATVNDQIFAAPNDVNPDALWYDKTALKDAGITDDPATLAAAGKWTTQAFLDMNAKLKNKGKTGTMFWNYWATHYGWISSQGGKAYDGDKFVANTDAAAIAAVDQLGKLFQNKTFVVADTLPSGAGADSVFISHKAGFFAQGRYTIGTVKEAGKPENYDIVDWPSPDGKAPSTGLAASYLAINAATKAPDAAKLFWSEFLSAEGQKTRLSGGGNAVPSIKGADDVVLDGYPAHAQTFLDMRDRGFVDYAAESRVPGLSSDIAKKFLELYQGKASAQDTLNATADLIAKAK